MKLFFKMLPQTFILTSFLLVLTNFVTPSEQQSKRYERNFQDAQLSKSECTITQTSKDNDFPSEEHLVVTEDGYVLTIFRMPKSDKCQDVKNYPPVLLMHGLLANSHSWLDTYPEPGLPLLLSDACYDLWLGNVRGNIYGRKHKRLSPNTDPEFWKFHSEEMGKYDLPAIIDYILTYTGANKLNYIAHSQGGRIFFTMCSELPMYCDKIGISINLAPAARLKYSRSLPTRLFMQLYTYLEKHLSKPYELEVLQQGFLIQDIGSHFCKNDFLADTVCRIVLAIIDSYDHNSIAASTLQNLYNNFPAGTSACNIAHYGQNFINLEFRKYDYGALKNFQVYGSFQPPLVNLNKTTIPVVVIYGENDFLVDKRDMTWLLSQLPNVQEGYLVEDPKWNHFDFLYSKHIDKLVFPKINEYLMKFTTDDG